MATVTNTVKLPDGSTPDRVDVVVELVASTTSRAAGWITASDVTLEAVVRPTVTNSAWTASLTPNADITPSGSVYKVTEYVDKTRYIHYITVGSGGGSLFDLLTDAPASIDPTGLAAHAASETAHGLGGAAVSDAQLKAWTQGEAYEPTAITRNSAGVVTSATVVWPDGSAGTFTATTVNSTYNAVDAYTVTHTTSGQTVTQAAVTRDSSGAVTTKPALTVA